MSAQPKNRPVVLTWYPQSGGVLIDADLDCHTGKALLVWIKRGIDFVVLDNETGRDITRVSWRTGMNRRLKSSTRLEAGRLGGCN